MAMPLCQCGHAWGEHAMPPHLDYDIDNGDRWCYADCDRCPCKRYVADLMDALRRALPSESALTQNAVATPSDVPVSEVAQNSPVVVVPDRPSSPSEGEQDARVDKQNPQGSGTGATTAATAGAGERQLRADLEPRQSLADAVLARAFAAEETCLHANIYSNTDVCAGCVREALAFLPGAEEYMDADGLLAAFINEQERVRATLRDMVAWCASSDRDTFRHRHKDDGVVYTPYRVMAAKLREALPESAPPHHAVATPPEIATSVVAHESPSAQAATDVVSVVREMRDAAVCDSDIHRTCRQNWPDHPPSWCVGCHLGYWADRVSPPGADDAK